MWLSGKSEDYEYAFIVQAQGTYEIAIGGESTEGGKVETHGRRRPARNPTAPCETHCNIPARASGAAPSPAGAKAAWARATRSSSPAASSGIVATVGTVYPRSATFISASIPVKSRRPRQSQAPHKSQRTTKRTNRACKASFADYYRPLRGRRLVRRGQSRCAYRTAHRATRSPRIELGHRRVAAAPGPPAAIRQASGPARED